MGPLPMETSLQKLPLIVDLDDTLITCDSFFMQARTLLRTRPWQLLPIIGLFFTRGRPAAKAYACAIQPIDASRLPYRTDFLAYLKQQKEQGRKIYLVSAANQDTVTRVANFINIFDGAYGSDDTHNLKAKNKARFIKEKIAPDFVYAGDAFADLAVWKEAKGAILCGKAVIFQARLAVPDALCFPDRGS